MLGAQVARGRPPTNAVLIVRDVEERILTACKTIRALPDREKRYQTVNSLWPEIRQDAADAYGYSEAIMPRFRPTPADVSDCLVALEWARPIERRQFKLVWWRSFGISFRHIGIRLGRSDETARQRYRDVILNIWYEANRIQSRG